ncbi:MAG TPA: trypsin-like peptidase domain-containing protein [Thermomicrobiaceae bacterium]|nr:trypsin-like peptidase domain-containing protein [Thermomicrobiaceae bacterium]
MSHPYRRFGLRLIPAFLIFLLAVGGYAFVRYDAPSLLSPAPVSAAGAATPTTGSATSFQAAVEAAVQKARPAVVQITNNQTPASQFGQAYSVPSGVGSGVIYDSQGHILTNNHVVAGAQNLLVSLPDGRSFPATVVGTDPQTDLAVIQIHGSNLPVAPLGDSSRLQVGQFVIAIGNALALPGGPTVTSGVVSALNRTVQEPSQAQSQSGSSSGSPFGQIPFGQGQAAQAQAAGPYLFDAIQTDAPINPGNSGGPLVDLTGQVIGINTLVAGQAEPGVQAQGIGFSIAMATAKPIADQLVATGHVDHPYIGISYTPLNPAIAAQLGVANTTGAVIGQVAPNSPGAAAGLQANDVVTAIDGTKLTTESSLAEAIDHHKPGDVVTLSVQRGSQHLSLKVTLGTMPASR